MTLINLEDVQKMLLKYKPNKEPLDVYFYSELMEGINSLPTHDHIAVLKDMVEEHEKKYRNTQSYSEDGNGWVRGYKIALEEAISRISPKQ